MNGKTGFNGAPVKSKQKTFTAGVKPHWLMLLIAAVFALLASCGGQTGGPTGPDDGGYEWVDNGWGWGQDENGTWVRENGSEYDQNGVNYYGYKANGLNKDTQQTDNGSHYGTDGLNWEGKTRNQSRDAEGYDMDGYDAAGYNRAGVDKDGNQKPGPTSPYTDEQWAAMNPDANGWGYDAANDKYVQRNGDEYLNGFNYFGYDQNGRDVNGLDGNGRLLDVAAVGFRPVIPINSLGTLNQSYLGSMVTNLISPANTSTNIYTQATAIYNQFNNYNGADLPETLRNAVMTGCNNISNGENKIADGAIKKGMGSINGYLDALKDLYPAGGEQSNFMDLMDAYRIQVYLDYRSYDGAMHGAGFTGSQSELETLKGRLGLGNDVNMVTYVNDNLATLMPNGVNLGLIKTIFNQINTFEKLYGLRDEARTLGLNPVTRDYDGLYFESIEQRNLPFVHTQTVAMVKQQSNEMLV